MPLSHLATVPVSALAAPPQASPTVAVLPFDMLRHGGDDIRIGDILADELIAALSASPRLKMISRLSTARLGGRAHCLAEARHLLGADYVVSGSCRMSGSELVVFGEVADAACGHVVWAGQLQSPPDSVLAPANAPLARMVREIAEAVVARPLPRVRRQALPSLHAHALLLGAIRLMHCSGQQDFAQAGDALERLADWIPEHPLPHAWRAHWHVLRLEQGWTDDPLQEALAAQGAADRALQRDPDCSLALTMDGLVQMHRGDLSLALRRLDGALAINPNEPLAWLLKGAVHAYRGEGKAAWRDVRQAQALSPLDPLRYYYDALAAIAALSAGMPDTAVDLAQRAQRANRLHAPTLRVLAIAQAMAGDRDGARSTAASLRRLDPSLTVRGYLARHPAGCDATGRAWSAALRQAGVPE